MKWGNKEKGRSDFTRILGTSQDKFCFNPLLLHVFQAFISKPKLKSRQDYDFLAFSNNVETTSRQGLRLLAFWRV